MFKKRLGVNIDHVATVRNARGENYPSPLRAALMAQKLGADSITIHLREDKKGQVLEEGINEAGSMASWIAAGTSYTNHDIEMIPIYLFYSMFDFQIEFSYFGLKLLLL